MQQEHYHRQQSERSGRRRSALAASLVVCLALTVAAQVRANPLPDSVLLEFGTVTTIWHGSSDDQLVAEVDRDLARVFDGPVTQERLNQALTSVFSFLKNQGYRQARIAPGDFIICEQRLNLTLKLDPGPRSIVSKVTFAGANRTDTTWLRQLVDLPTGVPMTEVWLSNARQRLSVVSHLSVIGEPTVEIIREAPDIQSTDVNVVFHVREDAPSRFDGLVAAGGQGAETALTGRASLQFGGLFGRDRTVFVHYDRQRPEWSALNLKYRENGAFGAPLVWSFEVDELTRRHRRQSVSSDIDYSFTANRNWKVGLGGLWRRITPNASSVTPARITELSLSVGKVTGPPRRDVCLQTSFTLNTSYSFRREIGSRGLSESVSRLRVYQNSSVALSLTRTWRLIATTTGQWWPVGNDDLGPGDEWYLGGTEMLRGYEQQWFSAWGGIWGSLELERHFGPLASMSVFGEMASLDLASAANTSSQTGTPYTLGWALSLQSHQRLGRLEFAWGRGASLRDGLLRLMISQSW